jgi:hypothetical protein
MKPSLPNSPAKLVLVALFGGFISAAAFLPTFPFHHFRPGSVVPLFWFFAILGMLAAGFYLAIQAESKIRDGIAGERWTASQLLPLRRVFQRRFITPITFALLAVGLILALMDMHHSQRVWPFILLSQSLNRIFAALKEPRPSTPPPNTSTYALIQSDHWGQR